MLPHDFSVCFVVSSIHYHVPPYFILFYCFPQPTLPCATLIFQFFCCPHPTVRCAILFFLFFCFCSRHTLPSTTFIFLFLAVPRIHYQVTLSSVFCFCPRSLLLCGFLFFLFRAYVTTRRPVFFVFVLSPVYVTISFSEISSLRYSSPLCFFFIFCSVWPTLPGTIFFCFCCFFVGPLPTLPYTT